MKRKSDLTAEAANHSGTGEPSKNRRTRKPQGKGNVAQTQPEWPEYFHSLFKIYKALNTVLAFVSSRKHIATSFPVVRRSVEGLLQHPLELAKVAEIKALLPDLIRFAYTPSSEIPVNGDSPSNATRRPGSPDFRIHPSPSFRSLADEEEHVLVLEFVEKSKRRHGNHPRTDYTVPPALTPADVKNLIEKRNNRFSQAINELLSAISSSDDPVALLQAAGQDHIPVNPSAGPSSIAFSNTNASTAVPKWEDRPPVDEVIAEILEQDWYQNQIVDRRTFDAKSGQFAKPDPPLSPTIVQALRDSRKIGLLYTHQVAAINAVAKDKSVIVSTPTASGKSVIYQVPLLRFLEDDLKATAIFVYPTKALAQDQRAALEQLLWSCPGLEQIKVANYDGDTPQEQRAAIRETASVIFTNFDMMHVSILPHEHLWRRFFMNLKLVAVDELHYYHGVLGSHVAQVVRRFRRLCAAVTNQHIRFVSCSATISNPDQHMRAVFGIDDIEVIVEDGAPSPKKDFIVWNPPPIDSLNPKKFGHRSSISEATGLMMFLMKRGIRVILFCKIRKVCELAMKSVRTALSAEGRLDILKRVLPYRGGYSQQDRRHIEREAFSGNLLGIVATNALELGVDIGVLDAVIMLGFPVSIASFKQQSGRAGRRSRDAMAVLVSDSLPIDQHYVAFPNELYETPTDPLVLDLDNKAILESHFQCAAQEMPMSLKDEAYFGPLTREICDTHLVKERNGWYRTDPKYLPSPAKYIHLRGAEEEKYVVVDVTKDDQAVILEEIEFSRALFELYEGAVFLHLGLTFIVKEISHDSKLAKVIRADVSWITIPRDFTDIDPIQTRRIREIKGSPQRAFYGRVDITTIVFGFFKVKNNRILDSVYLENEPWKRESTGMWIDVPSSSLELLRSKDINPAGAIHSAEHAFLNRFALASDLRTECKVPEKEYRKEASQRKRPARLIFYDCNGKDSMISVKAFDQVLRILHLAQKAVESCHCDSGCEKCVQSASCKEGNMVCSKVGAYIILRELLGMEIDADAIPMQGDALGASETVVEADSVKLAKGDVVVETDGY